MPDLASEVWATPRRLAKLMSPSLRRRVQFIDRRKTLWHAVERYFEPFRTVAADGKVNVAHILQIDYLALAVYQTLIALKFNCEVAIAADTVHVASYLLNLSSIDAERRARVAVISGLLKTIVTLNAPTLVFNGNRNEPIVQDLMSAILDDAEFLQASRLRRFLSYESNRRALLRDIRRAASIVSRRPLFRAVLSIAMQPLTLLPVGKTLSGFVDTLTSQVHTDSKFVVSSQPYRLSRGLRLYQGMPHLFDPNASVLSWSTSSKRYVNGA